MKLEIKKPLLFGLFVLTIFPTFFLPLIGVGYTINIIFLSLSIIGCTYCAWSEKKIFPALLFFTIVQLTFPISFWLSATTGMWFPGIYYLPPILIFLVVLLLFKNIRNNITWWQKTKIDKIAWLMIIGLGIVSGAALLLWSIYNQAEFTSFTKQLPNMNIYLVLLSGLGFAILNASAEEFLSRGMLMEGFGALIQNKYIVVVLQSIIFGISHYSGFPNGITGVLMVFSWSIILGLIRIRTSNLTAVIVAHFFADFIIYLILYSNK